jgi:hypothetical protein
MLDDYNVFLQDIPVPSDTCFVSVAAIASTTSIPSMTRAKTA